MSDQDRLEIIRVFKTTPERLYDAWTVPEQIVQWFGPEGVTIGEHSFETRENGNWRAEFLGDMQGRVVATGTYKVLDRPNRIVTSWCWEFDGVKGETTELEISFAATRDGTRLTLLHSKFADAETRDKHHGGWTSSTTCLEDYIAGNEGTRHD